MCPSGVNNTGRELDFRSRKLLRDVFFRYGAAATVPKGCSSSRWTFPGVSWRSICRRVISGSALLALLLGAIAFLASVTTSVSSDEDFRNSWTELLPATIKLDLIWQRLEANREPEPWGGILELLIRGFLFQTDATEPISQSSTLRQHYAQRKVIHTQGAFARIKWKARGNDLGYTGMFAEPEAVGLISISKGSRVLGSISNSWGLGWKLFRDNAPPAASVMSSPTTVLHHVTNYNWNLLDAPLCNHVDVLVGTGLLTMARKRPQATAGFDEFWTRYGNGFGLSNFADTTAAGVPVTTPHFPFAICFRAQLPLAEQFRDTPFWHHPVEPASRYPTGALLFEVLAIDSPGMLGALDIRQHAVVIGEIWTESEFISSRWGDLNMSFQHQKFEDDLALRPAWRPSMTLNHVLMDGWAYVGLYADRLQAPTMEEAVITLLPNVMYLLQALTNPAVAAQVLHDDIGIGYLKEIIHDLLQQLGELAAQVNALAGRNGGLLLPATHEQQPHTSQGDDGSSKDAPVDGVEEEEEMERANNTSVPSSLKSNISLSYAGLLPPVTIGATFSRGSSAGLSSLVHTSDSECPLGKTGEPVSSSGDLYTLPALLSAGRVSVKAICDTAKAVAENVELDGHFVRPKNLEAMQALLGNPVIEELIAGIVRLYRDRFGFHFLQDLLNSIVEANGNITIEEGVSGLETEAWGDFLNHLVAAVIRPTPSDASSAATVSLPHLHGNAPVPGVYKKERRLSPREGEGGAKERAPYTESPFGPMMRRRKCDRQDELLRRLLEKVKVPFQNLGRVNWYEL